MKRRTLVLGGLITFFDWLITACTSFHDSRVAVFQKIITPSLPQNPIDTPMSSLSVELISEDAGKAVLTPHTTNFDELVLVSHSFRIQLNEGVGEVTLSATISLQENIQENTLSLYKKDEENSAWFDQDAHIEALPDRKTARVAIKQSGIYLLGRPSPLGIAPTTWFDDAPSFKAGFYELTLSGIGSHKQDEFVAGLSYEGLSGSFLSRRGTQKVAIIFIHGMYDEQKNRFEEFFSWIKNDAPQALRDFFQNNCVFLSFKFDTRRMVDENTAKLLSLIPSFGVMPYLLVGFSMGGLVARIAHALSFLKGDNKCLGVITLSTPHHGSPLAIPKWVRAALHKLLFGTHIYALYLIAINNFFAPIQFKTYSRKIIEALKNTSDTIFPSGFRCLFADNGDPSIPKYSFFSRLWLGVVPFLVNEELFPDDQYGVVCGQLSSEVQNLSFEKKETLFGCRTNFAKGTRLLEEKAGVSQRPFMTVYGGYYGNLLHDDTTSVLKDFSQNSSSQVLIKDHSSHFEGIALRIFNTLLFPLLPLVAREKISSVLFNDGLVHLSSQLNLQDGPSFVSQEATRSNLLYDEKVIRKRLPSCVRDIRIFRDKNHAQILKRGSDDTLFVQLGNDIMQYAAEYRLTASFDISSADRIAITDTISKMFAKQSSSTFYDSNGRGTFENTTRVIESVITPDNQHTDSVEVRVRTHSERWKYQNGTTMLKSEDDTTYYVYLGRILGRWYPLGRR